MARNYDSSSNGTVVIGRGGHRDHVYRAQRMRLSRISLGGKSIGKKSRSGMMWVDIFQDVKEDWLPHPMQGGMQGGQQV